MLQNDLNTLHGMTERRDAAKAAWMRHLHLLAAGALTLLAGMDAGTNTTETAQCWMQAAWVALGIAILSGGACLYGETAKYAALSMKLSEELYKALQRGDAGGFSGPIVTSPRPF
jgi:hypothetical protein